MNIQPYTETPDGYTKATLDMGFEVTRYNKVINEWETHPTVDFEEALLLALDMFKNTEDKINNTVKVQMYVSCYNGQSVLTDTKDIVTFSSDGNLVINDETAQRVCLEHLSLTR